MAADHDGEDWEEEAEVYKRTRRRRPQYEAEGEEELADEGDLTELVNEIANCRQLLHEYDQHLRHLLATNPELAQRYRQFQMQGGVSKHDWTRFRLGLLRPKVVRQRKHLRLIARCNTNPRA
jgi:hypothetical protein